MMQKLVLFLKKSLVLFFITSVFVSQASLCYEQPEELSIVVIIPSYNNEQYYKENLDSVFKQKYAQFRVIYINDASTDATGELVEAYVQSSGMGDKVTIIHNEYNRKALMNIYQAVHMCDDNDLIVVLDGDDQFAHDHVLAKFNRVHADGSIWLSYAQYINWPPMAALQNKIPILGYAAQTPQDIIDAKNYRWCYKWFWSGLRGFRAWFFKCIKISSLFLDVAPGKGKLLPIMYDAAIMWPMMEMGGEHTKFIPDILLTRTITPLNDFHVTGDELKKAVRRVLRNQKAYPTVHDRDGAALIHERQKNRGISVMLMSHAPDDTQSTLNLLTHTLFTKSLTKERADWQAAFLDGLSQRSLGPLEKQSSLQKEIHLTSTNGTNARVLCSTAECSKRSNASSCCVLCNNNPADVCAYQALAQQYSNVTFLHSTDLHTTGGNQDSRLLNRGLLTDQLIAYLQSIDENHVLVIDDTSLLSAHAGTSNGWLNFDNNGVAISCQSRQSVSDRLNSCIAHLESTYAYGFYFGLSRDDFAAYKDQSYGDRPYEQLYNGMSVWQFKCHTPATWPQHKVLPVLYRVADVIKMLKRVSATTVDQIIGQWGNQAVSGDNVGLFFDR